MLSAGHFPARESSEGIRLLRLLWPSKTVVARPRANVGDGSPARMRATSTAWQTGAS